ncbi:MAG: hypothetical protein AAGI07_05105 [Bacteroidota bacterium]
MNTSLRFTVKLLSFIGLGLTIFPSFLVFAQILSLAAYKHLMLIGTLIWLFTAPFWINQLKEKP